MPEQTAIVLTQADKEALLTERELREYRIYMRLQQPPMAQSTQAGFFNLFLQGNNCEEIQRLNPNGFSLGAIVRARIDNDWDLKLQEHQQQLMTKVRERVQQVTLETVERIANEMAASNRLVNDRVKKFLQTGDVVELQGTSVGSVKHLKEMVEMLAKLTGQDSKKTTQVGGTVEHRHVMETAPVNPALLPELPVGKPLPPQTAAKALEIIHKSRQGGGE
jgi:hypothetical protein